MDVNKIQSADILDIIFDGRNKEYGAYDLRKTYNKRMIKALVGTILIILLAVLGNLLANSTSSSKTELIVQDVSLENMQQEEKKPEPPPPPPPPKQEPPKVEITKFTPPKIVKDEEVKEEDEIKELQEQVEKKVKDSKPTAKVYTRQLTDEETKAIVNQTIKTLEEALLFKSKLFRGF